MNTYIYVHFPCHVYSTSVARYDDDIECDTVRGLSKLWQFSPPVSKHLANRSTQRSFFGAKVSQFRAIIFVIAIDFLFESGVYSSYIRRAGTTKAS